MEAYYLLKLRALLVHWNTASKSHQNIESVQGGVQMSLVSSIYDPLDLVCPFVLHAKLKRSASLGNNGMIP